MFAGAAREVVFSNPEVARRVNADFVPVALKAALVNSPLRGIEGNLYGEIGRSKPAPQGICAVNSSGKVLAWALSFDDDKSIVKFLDYVAARYKEYPDAKTPVPAKRFMRFPSQAMDDVADNGKSLTVPRQHAQGDRCPARPVLQPGTLVGRIIGRALDKQGKPAADAIRQEHYLESRFEILPDTQELLAQAVTKAGGERFRVPDDFVRALVNPAFLGQLDVNPLGSVPGSQNDSRRWEFWGRRVSAAGAVSIRIQIDGSSHVAGGQRTGDPRARDGRSDGRIWDHTVTLDWQGYIDLEPRADLKEHHELKQIRVTELMMIARGKERLRWGNSRFPFGKEPDAAHLMAGHPIDLDCGVRYGLFAEPCSAEETQSAAARK